jgi:hypothetical protein
MTNWFLQRHLLSPSTAQLLCGAQVVLIMIYITGEAFKLRHNMGKSSTSGLKNLSCSLSVRREGESTAVDACCKGEVSYVGTS